MFTPADSGKSELLSNLLQIENLFLLRHDIETTRRIR